MSDAAFYEELLKSAQPEEAEPVVDEVEEEVEAGNETEEEAPVETESKENPDYSGLTKTLSERLGIEVDSLERIPEIFDDYKKRVSEEFEARQKSTQGKRTPLFEKLTNYVENSSDPDKALLDFVAINTTDYDKILKDNPLEIIIQGMKANKKYSALSEETIRKQVEKKFGLDRTPFDEMDEDERKDVLSDMQFAAIEGGHLDLLKSHQAEMQKPDLQKQREENEAALQKVWAKYNSDVAKEISLIEKEGLKVDDYVHKISFGDGKKVNKDVTKTIEAAREPVKWISRFYNFETGEINAKEIIRMSLIEEQLSKIAAGIKTNSKTEAVREIHSGIENPLKVKSEKPLSKVSSEEEKILIGSLTGKKIQ